MRDKVLKVLGDFRCDWLDILLIMVLTTTVVSGLTHVFNYNDIFYVSKLNINTEDIRIWHNVLMASIKVIVLLFLVNFVMFALPLRYDSKSVIKFIVTSIGLAFLIFMLCIESINVKGNHVVMATIPSKNISGVLNNLSLELMQHSDIEDFELKVLDYDTDSRSWKKIDVDKDTVLNNYVLDDGVVTITSEALGINSIRLLMGVPTECTTALVIGANILAYGLLLVMNTKKSDSESDCKVASDK